MTNRFSDKIKKWLSDNKWLADNYDHVSNVVSAILSVILSLIASFVYDQITEDEMNATNIYIGITLVVFVLALIVLISVGSQMIKKNIFTDIKYNDYIQKAYIAIQNLSLKSQAILQENCADTYDSKCLINWAVDSMQFTVDKCYDFFYTSFSNSVKLIEETKFEVTFMTLSYKDGGITIPCSCNREGRTPTSMLMREGNPNIYDETITAEIYEEYRTHCKPSFKIIPNTDKDYNFIYDNQQDRIKSSIVLPVLSHKSELLGTLVVHCNTKNFFEKTERNFWYEIMQLFASEVGKYKLLLDYILEEGEGPF